MGSHHSALLVMLKPDGAQRQCSPSERRLIGEAWTDLVAWLHGADPDTLPHAELVGYVAQKAALRMVRFAEYDIGTWASQAQALRDPVRGTTPHEPSVTSLSGVVAELLTGIGLRLDTSASRWLNRVTIELLYRDAPGFDCSRDVLVRRLLDGPVVIQTWVGDRLDLAYAVKLIVRRALSAAQLTNLLHLEKVTPGELHFIQMSMVE